MTSGLLQADIKAQNENLVAANFKGLSKDCHADVSNGLSRHTITLVAIRLRGFWV